MFVLGPDVHLLLDLYFIASFFNCNVLKFKLICNYHKTLAPTHVTPSFSKLLSKFQYKY